MTLSLTEPEVELVLLALVRLDCREAELAFERQTEKFQGFKELEAKIREQINIHRLIEMRKETHNE